MEIFKMIENSLKKKRKIMGLKAQEISLQNLMMMRKRIQPMSTERNFNECSNERFTGKKKFENIS